MNIEEKIDKLEQELNELKKQAKNCKPKYWKPEDGEKAWYLRDNRITADFRWSSRVAKGLIATGNVFQSKEEAEKELKLRLATQRLKEAIWEANGGKFIRFTPYSTNIVIINNKGVLKAVNWTELQIAQNWMYIKDPLIAEKVLEENRRDFEIYYGLNQYMRH